MFPNCEKRPENLFFRSISLDSALSMMVGKESRRRVWPVGAVSKTMQLKFMFCTIFISSANDIASSTPGMELDMSENMLPDRIGGTGENIFSSRGVVGGTISLTKKVEKRREIVHGSASDVTWPLREACPTAS